MPPTPPAPNPPKQFMRGAKPTPEARIRAAPTYRKPTAAPVPAQSAIVPASLSVWGNDTYGDCVTAEEAFAKACHDPEIFVTDATVIRWAKAHGWLNGADLLEVMQAMQDDGFVVGPQKYDDGHPMTVDYTTESVLQAAISTGPVKIAIDADALPTSAGNQQGWHAAGGSHQYPNTDHCVALCGYGPTAWLYQQLGVPLPPGLPSFGYLLFTWGTIGWVDHRWLMSTCTEAWVRNPTTVGVPPLPEPPPLPPPPPGPPLPGGGFTGSLVFDNGALTAFVPAIGAAKGFSWQDIIQIIQMILQLLADGVPSDQIGYALSRLRSGGTKPQ